MTKRSMKRAFLPRQLAHYFEGLEPRLLMAAAPDLFMTLVQVTAPSVLVPGDKISVNLKVTNGGPGPAVGTIDIGIYASADTVWDAGDVLLGSVTGKSINLKFNKSVTTSGPLPIQPSLLPGTYHVVARVTSNLSVADGNAGNDQAASDGTGDVLWSFGNVGSRKNVAMTLAYAGVPSMKFSLTGAGTGVIDNPGSAIGALNVTVNNSTAASNMSITTPAKTFSTINSIDVAGSIGKIAAGSINLESGVAVGGLAGAITVHDIQSVAHYINLNVNHGAVPASAKVNITANVINACNIDTGGVPIGTLSAYTAADLVITAPTVQNITLTDKVKTDVTLSGVLKLDQGGAVVPANAKVNISAGWVQNCELTTGSLPIGMLTVYRASSLTLMAPYIQTMNVTDKTVMDTALSGTITLESFYGLQDWSLGKLAVAGNVSEFSLVMNEGGANSISARSWETGVLTAMGTVGSLSITESMTADVSGIWISKATIGGDYSGHWTAGFGSLTIKADIDDSVFDVGQQTGGLDWKQFNALSVWGWINNSTISAANPVGSITTGGMRDSAILIGAGSSTFPGAQGEFETHHTGTLASMTISGIKESGHFVASMINSNIAAWTIDTLKLAPIETANGGAAFGVATTMIKNLTYRPLVGPVITAKNLDVPGTDSQTDGDFQLRIL